MPNYQILFRLVSSIESWKAKNSWHNTWTVLLTDRQLVVYWCCFSQFHRPYKIIIFVVDKKIKLHAMSTLWSHDTNQLIGGLHGNSIRCKFVTLLPRHVISFATTRSLPILSLMSMSLVSTLLYTVSWSLTPIRRQWRQRLRFLSFFDTSMYC